jgi:hypothetical protein
MPLQIVDRTTIVASAIGVRGHKKPHVIEAERSGIGLRASGRGKARGQSLCANGSSDPMRETGEPSTE